MQVQKLQSVLFALLLLTTPFGCLGEDETSGKGDNKEKESIVVGFLKAIGKCGAIAGGAAVTAAKGATAGLAGAGFTGTGVVGGSFAAGIQSTIGNVIIGSAFASLQSVATTGGLAVLGPVGIGGAGVAIIGCSAYSYMRDDEENEDSSSSDQTSPK